MTTTALAIVSPQENALQVFQFDNVATGDSFTLSAQETDGQAWFVAADVCNALGLHPTATRRLDDDEKGLRITQTLGGPQQVVVINEAGLFRLVFSSHKAGAKHFTKWVTSHVLPSIRKHGGYINGQEALSAAEQAQTLQAVQDEALRVALHVENRDARSGAFRLMKGSPSYGPGGRKGGRLQ